MCWALSCSRSSSLQWLWAGSSKPGCVQGLLLQTEKWDSPADHLPGTFDKTKVSSRSSSRSKPVWSIYILQGTRVLSS